MRWVPVFMHPSYAAIGLLMLLVLPAAATAQSTLVIPRVPHAPTLAEVADDRLPNSARVADFRQREPGDGIPASQATIAYVLYDEKNLYVGFRCRAGAGQLRARMAKREYIGDDDQVAVYLDTFHDRQRAYVFAVNPLGIQLDAIQVEGEDPDDTFDTVWQADAMLTDEGFAALITIPFRSLRFTGSATHTWGLALGRSMPLGSEQAFWPAITKRIEGFTNQMALIELEGISSKRIGNLIPYGATTSSRFLDTTEPAFFSANDGRAGFDAKVVMHDALALDVTVHPDFSQVESDEPQVTINRRFEVYFPERRPFFIENANFFDTPDQLFFSRRVLDPRVGARLTGKVGGWTLGAMAEDDRAADQDSDESASGAAAIGVARLQRDLGAQSRVAVLATGRRGPSGTNVVISTDARLKLGPTWVFTGQAAHSRSRASGGSHAAGTDYYGEIARSGRAFSYTGSYLDRGPLFDPQLGYVDRVDIRETEQDLSYTWYPTDSRLLSFGPAFTAWADWNHRGERRDWYAEPGVNFSFEGPAKIQFSRVENEEIFEGLSFRQHLTKITGSDAHVKSLVVTGGLTVGSGVNYQPPAGVLPAIADTLEATAGVTWRPARRLRVDETYFCTRLRPRAVAGAVADGVASAASRIFENHITRTKLNYQFTRRLSARVIVDYDAVLPNPSLAIQALTKHLTGDVLLTYLVDPFTALYVGYSDRVENVALTPSSPARLESRGSPTTSTGRQLFVKVSYGMRF